MLHQTDDLRIAGLRPLIPPAILFEELPITERASTVVAEGREQATRIVKGEDDRLLVVVGPCSIHDPTAALEYARRLLPVPREAGRRPLHPDAGLLREAAHDGRLEGADQRPRTSTAASRSTAGCAARASCCWSWPRWACRSGSEFLDTISPQFIADLISWGAIGARTTESQVHRELASGLSVPVGFKNGTDGNVQICIDAIRAAAGAHHFLSVTKQGLSAIVETQAATTRAT